MRNQLSQLIKNFRKIDDSEMENKSLMSKTVK